MLLTIRGNKLPKNFTNKEILDYFLTVDMDIVAGIVFDSVINRYGNRVQIVQTAIKVGYNINNIRYGHGNKIKYQRLIELVIRQNDLELFLLCIKEKADLTEINNDSMLHIALYAKNVFATKYFCKTMDVNALDSNEMTPIDITCRMLNIELLDILLQNNAKESTDGPEFLIEFVVGKLDPLEHKHIDFNDQKLITDSMNMLIKLIDRKLIDFRMLMTYSLRFIVSKKIDILKTIVDHYPEVSEYHFANNDGNSLLALSICINYTEFTLYLLDKISSDALKSDRSNSGSTCLHEAAHTGNPEVIRKILLKCKDLVNINENNSANCMEYLYVPREISFNAAINEHRKTREEMIEMTKLLIESGCDLNNVNNKHRRPLHNAILHWDQILIQELIESGCLSCLIGDNLQDEKKINIDTIWNPLINNDMISYAVWCNKPEIVELLVEKNATLFYIEVNGMIVYASVIFAIMCMRINILRYLLQINEIKESIDLRVRRYLYKKAISFACNDEILELILSIQTPNQLITSVDNTNDTDDQLNVMVDFSNENQPKVIEAHFDTYFDIYLKGYSDCQRDQRIETLLISYTVTDILCNTIHLCGTNDQNVFCRKEDGQYSKQVRGMLSKIDDMLDFIDEAEYQRIINKHFEILHIRTMISYSLLYTMFYRIMHLYHNYHNWNLVKLRKQTQTNQGNDSQTNSYLTKAMKWQTNEKDTGFEIIHYVRLLTDQNHIEDLAQYRDYVIKIARMLYSGHSDHNAMIDHDLMLDDKHDEPDHDDAIKERKKQSMNQLSVNEIKQLLRKLSNPIKVPHYDYIYNLLLNDPAIYKEPEPKSKNICATLNNIEYHVINIKSKKPVQWFDFYGKNIGKEGKDDELHMFPMSFDQILKSYHCVTRISENDAPDQDQNVLMYFYGKIVNLKTNESIDGCYEYIVNSRGTLFHRFFKPIQRIPEDVATDIKKRSKH